MGPKTLVGLLCIANLVAGVGLGVTVDRLILPHAQPKRVRPGHGGHGDRGPGGDRPGGDHGPVGDRPGGDRGPGGDHGDRGGRELQRLVEKLELDKAQTEQVRDLLAQRRPLFADVMKDMRPRIRKLRDETDALVRGILRPEQAARYDEFHREAEQRERDREQRERESGENADSKKDTGRGIAPVNTGDGRSETPGGK